MPPAYWIVHVSVSDPEAYQVYRQAVTGVLSRFGGQFIVRAAPQEVVEGGMRPRTVVIRFPDLAAAKGCYVSSEYQEVRKLRAACSVADFCIIEGCDPV